ncbi:vitamin K epoxide reductase family protein [Actinocrinis puniceicyclus]|uniref:Vitamin K epoxide reductase family protein n=1 Tax=Actinocrinis puniceicyclus TaxID=977794 RepID=A0A8J7WKJ6_9ACTN|nr:vitamin K epoxide reductase family protein [Actinocrinis puniceicyclus]MBS2964001.1 vitamin K epoxide reductase family protein [Actinocrinis puniceicyclus]
MSTNTNTNTNTSRTGREAVAASRPGAPRWALIAAPLTAAAGLAVSIYLTVAHYTTTVTLACPQSATVNCEKVTTSAQSQFLGMPVAVLGTGYFAVMLLLCLPWTWRADRPVVLRHVRVLAALGGVGFVAWLVYAELFVINAICLWCTTVHALTLVLFGVVAFGTAAAADPADPADPADVPARAGRSRRPL